MEKNLSINSNVKKKRKKKYTKRKIKDMISAYLFLLPALAFFFTFVLYPMLKGIYLSLFRFSQLLITLKL